MSKLKSAVLYEYLTKVRAIRNFLFDPIILIVVYLFLCVLLTI